MINKNILLENGVEATIYKIAQVSVNIESSEIIVKLKGYVSVNTCNADKYVDERSITIPMADVDSAILLGDIEDQAMLALD